MFSKSYIAPELTSKTGVSNGKKDNAQQLNGSFFKGALTEAFFATAVEFPLGGGDVASVFGG